MKRFKMLLGATMLLIWLVPMVVAQNEEEEEKGDIDAKRTTRVTLGSTAGTPGTSVVVPIYFTPAEGLQVGSLKMVVDFVSANLKFSKLDPGITAEMGNVQINTEAKQGKNEKGTETTTITITASLPSSSSPDKGISPGLLGYLTFRLNDDARPANITLRTTAQANELKTNKPVQDLRAFDAKVDVVEAGNMPTVACFFFTH